MILLNAKLLEPNRRAWSGRNASLKHAGNSSDGLLPGYKDTDIIVYTSSPLGELLKKKQTTLISFLGKVTALTTNQLSIGLGVCSKACTLQYSSYTKVSDY